MHVCTHNLWTYVHCVLVYVRMNFYCVNSKALKLRFKQLHSIPEQLRQLKHSQT